MKRSLQFVVAVAVLFFATPLFAQLSVPEIPYDSNPDFLKLPNDIYLGEVAGVATNSRGHIFVYTRTGSVNAGLGANRAFVRNASRLFQFDQTGKYVREIGQGLYGFLVAHSVRVDPQDNVWVVDEMANMVIKFDPNGRMVMAMGRKPEAIRVPALPLTPPAPPPAPPAAAAQGAAPAAGAGGGGGGGGAAATGAGVPGDNFNRPSDVAWDAAGNIYVADGHGNARVAKFDKNGKFIKSWGTRGTGPSQFNSLHSIAVDAQGNVYVADHGNRRIQVFDGDGNFKTQYLNVGAPAAICITPGARQFLYSSNSNDSGNMEDGEIYKMELDGKIVGKFGMAGKLPKEFGTVNSIDCRNENDLYVGELANWRVQKLTLRAPRVQSSAR